MVSQPARSAVITGASSAFPPGESQQVLWDEFFAGHFAGRRGARSVFAAAGVEHRHAVANPTVDDVSQWSTGRRMARYVAEAVPLGKEALTGALGQAGLDAGDLGLLVVASCTGYATPGLDILLAQDLAMSPTLERLLLGHVGCHAAMPGLGVARDFVLAHGRPAALVCVELTSLHLQPPTDDLEQIVVHALFGDAASAVIVSPHERGTGPLNRRKAPVNATAEVRPSGLEILASAASTAPGTADHMTWEVTDLGFRMGLARSVPDAIAAGIGALVERLIARAEITRDDVTHWAIHPGGPRVLECAGDALGLGREELDGSRRVLAEHGNCSSATILVVIDQIASRCAVGDVIVALTFGPGLTLYGCVLRAVPVVSPA